MGTKARNEKIDIVRGIAILMVVMGHALSAFQGAENTFVYNVIFAVQMPLFMIISGYVAIYSKSVDGLPAFGKRLARRTVALMLPWVVWTIIRYIVTAPQQSIFDYMSYLFGHMDTGYWFLVSLWTIDFIFNLSALFSSIGKQKQLNKYHRLLVQCGYIGVLFALLFVIGRLVGFNVFAIRYSLYYLPFFCLGYLFACVSVDIVGEKWFDVLSAAVVAVCGLAFAILCVKFNVQGSDDSIFNIAVRIITSLSGCAVIFWTIDKLSCTAKAWSIIKFYGNHSLELYIIHYFFLNLVNTEGIELFSSFGIPILFMNYVISIVSSTVLIYVINSNRFLKKILFGKK